MTSAEVVVVNRLGLHARPSARLTATASRYRSEVWLSKGTRRVNAKSIMGVMMLAAAKDSTLVIEAEGPDEAEAVEALRALIASGFEEELGS
ncbi:MAG TPA: HPr family phosphocarrier protein [Zeimonas sp.]|nr:HPr family phosphocarrier protein [Zeimonas sp.]